MEPLSPKEVQDTFEVPDFVIGAFNNLLIKNYDGMSNVISISLEEARVEIYKLNKSEQPLQTKWLNIESLYKSKGWFVEFHSPDRYETYEEYYSFKMPK